jgi:hypothetical protein
VQSVFRACGTTIASALSPYPSYDTSRLVRERDVASLFQRIILTEGIDRVSLAGMVDFLRAGGSFRDLNGNDATPFDRIMGKRVLKHRFLGSSQLIAMGLAKLLMWLWNSPIVPDNAGILRRTHRKISSTGSNRNHPGAPAPPITQPCRAGCQPGCQPADRMRFGPASGSRLSLEL